jgi:hypothetical protein
MNQFKQGKNIGHWVSMHLTIAVLMVFVVSFLLFSLFSFFSPLYVSLPIHPPDYNGNGYTGDWEKITYSKLYLITPINIKILDSYILREESTVTNNDASWNSIATYFDTKMSSIGWVRSSDYASCNFIMPEANFLPQGENGIIHYRRINYRPEQRDQEMVCLAIWKDSTEQAYYITLVTFKPSLLLALSNFNY